MSYTPETHKTTSICVHDIQSSIFNTPDTTLSYIGKIIGDALNLDIRWTNIRDAIYNPDGGIGHFTITDRMNKSRLLPCPFCGAAAEMKAGIHGEFFAMCSSGQCGARLGSGIWFVDEKQAAETWNRRAGLTKKIQRIECKKALSEFDRPKGVTK